MAVEVMGFLGSGLGGRVVSGGLKGAGVGRVEEKGRLDGWAMSMGIQVWG